MVAANDLVRCPVPTFGMKIFFISLFFLASALNFRLRDPSVGVHVGGGELAISPYDFVILLSFIFVSVWREVRFDLLCLSIFVVVLFSLVSVFAAVHPEFVFYEVFRVVKFFFLFLFLRSFFRDRRVVAALPFIVSMVVFFELFYSVYQYFFLSGEVTEDATSVRDLFVENGVVRVSGTLRHPALLSFYVVLLVPLLILGGVVSFRLFYFAAVISAFICVGLTFSRTQMVLSLFSVFLCFCFFRHGRGGRLMFGRAAFAMFAVGLIFVLFVIYVNIDVILDRFLNAPQSSFTTRVLLAEIALRMIADNPLFGIGLNNFIYAMPDYDPQGVRHYFPHPVHNMYLLIAAEMGLIGFLSYVIFFILFVFYVVRCLGLLPPLEGNYIKAALISFSLLFITGMQGWSFRADSIQLLLVMYMALALSVRDGFLFERKFSGE